MKLDKSVYDNFYKGYIDKVTEEDWRSALEAECQSTIKFINKIPEDKCDYRYAEGKWSLKEVLIHLLDCERIMAYRALCFARGDKTTLPGFDENKYAPNSNASNLTLDTISEAYKAQRDSTLLMFQSFSENMMDEQGSANGIILSARALAFIIAGHAYHHGSVLKERYLV